MKLTPEQRNALRNGEDVVARWPLDCPCKWAESEGYKITVELNNGYYWWKRTDGELTVMKEIELPHKVGDVLAIGERWLQDPDRDDNGNVINNGIIYTAYKYDSSYYIGTEFKGNFEVKLDWPSIWQDPESLPDELCRIKAEVVEIRVERLQESYKRKYEQHGHQDMSDTVAYHIENHNLKCKWNSLYPDFPWKSNPWVCVVGLKGIK